MRNSKTKTALPAPTGRAAVETGKHVCIKSPAPIIAQNKAFDQNFLGRC